MKVLKEGDKIYWQYTHHLNSRSSIEIIRSGVFVRMIKGNKDYCLVKFKGNKGNSRIKYSELFDENKKSVLDPGIN